MMRAVVVAAVLISMRLWPGVVWADDSWIQQVAERVRAVDDTLLKHIEQLAATDKNVFLNDMREYVQAIRSLQSCMQQDRQSTRTIAQDILQEEGPKFYYHYDPEYIQNALNWSESEMDECNLLKKQAIDVWMEIDRQLSDDEDNNAE